MDVAHSVEVGVVDANSPSPPQLLLK